MNRKATPDILSSLMGGAVKKEVNKPSEQENNKAIKQVNPKGKEKATFNLHKHTLNVLEEAWIEIRKLRGDKRVSRSDIVDQAIEEALSGFNLKKHLSRFYGKLGSNK